METRHLLCAFELQSRKNMDAKLCVALSAYEHHTNANMLSIWTLTLNCMGLTNYCTDWSESILKMCKNVF